MGFTKLQLGLTGALVVAGAGGWTVQHQAAEKLGRDVAALRVDESELAAWRAENQRMARAAADRRRARADEAEAARLRDEVATLTRQVDERARAAEAAGLRARSAASDTAMRRAAPDAMPRLSTSQAPVYPAVLRAAGVEGQVLVDFVVGADGEAHDVVAVDSSHPEFAAAAVEAVQQWRFVPGVKGQRAVNTRMRQAIAFSLAKGAEAVRVVPRSDSFWPQ